MSRYCPDIGSNISNIGSDIGKNVTISCLDDTILDQGTILETVISGHTLISVRVLSLYRGRYSDIIFRLVLNFFVPSGAPSRDQPNDPDDDDEDDLNGDQEMYADEMRMHRAGQVRSPRRHGLVTAGAAQAGVGHGNLSWSRSESDISTQGGHSIRANISGAATLERRRTAQRQVAQAWHAE
jgi:hypothetical protein